MNSAELHAYSSESWWTAAGARKKERRLLRAGLPDFSNWRFVTVTIADRTVSPHEAYTTGKDRIRRFLARLRVAVGREFLWCWKLEFHHDDGGYPHWHLLIEYRQEIPQEMLAQVGRWWGLGRINVRRVKARDIRYVFKYVTKVAEEVPEWIGRYKGRIRVFQTSRAFYTQRQARAGKREEGAAFLFVPRAQALLLAGRRVLAVENSPSAKQCESLPHSDGPNHKASRGTRVSE